MLVASVVTYAVSGLGSFDRDRLVVFDALLMVVLALVLYGLSAREATRRAGLMDAIQLVAVVSALILDVMVLGSMLARIGDLGFTPNRVAALGLNLVLLLNLTWAAWLSVRFLAGRVAFPRLRAVADELPADLRHLGERGGRFAPASLPLRLMRPTRQRRRRPASRADARD